MSRKQPRVPGMRSTILNRALRRHPEKLQTEERPLARDDTADAPAADTENVINGREQKKTNVANQYR